MKNLKGINAMTVRNAILKEFELQILNSRKKNVIDISEWKKLKEVRECYDKLYDDDDNAIKNIIKQAFPSISHKNKSLFNDVYVYTTSICNIILNPDYSDLECVKKPLEKQFRRFKVIFFLLIKMKIIKNY